ncbi:MAG: iron-sulfur cluster assembly protein [Haloarculaceae archaeon]|jgi:metal-sulfur cluster biosynthetic enzyme
MGTDGTDPSPLAVREQLDGIVDPCSEARGTDISIVEMGLLKRIEVEDGSVHVELRITSPSCMMVGYFIEQANERVGSLPGVEEVTLSTDAGLSWRDEMMAEEARERRREHQQALADRYAEERTATAAPAAED